MTELIGACVVERIDPEAVAKIRNLDYDRFVVERKESEAVGLEADRWSDRLRSRFKQTSERMDRAGWLRYVRSRTVWIEVVLGIVGGSYLAVATASPSPMGVTVRHLLAARNCDMARTVNLAPATIGSPGYWARNDADDDGVACEPWPR